MISTDKEPLEEEGNWTPQQGTFTYPNGTHICELEINKETGRIIILSYYVVDDFGKVINPMLLEGQVHGGIVQGIGQALFEETQYDENGQLAVGLLWTTQFLEQVTFLILNFLIMKLCVKIIC